MSNGHGMKFQATGEVTNRYEFKSDKGDMLRGCSVAWLGKTQKFKLDEEQYNACPDEGGIVTISGIQREGKNEVPKYIVQKVVAPKLAA